MSGFIIQRAKAESGNLDEEFYETTSDTSEPEFNPVMKTKEAGIDGIGSIGYEDTKITDTDDSHTTHFKIPYASVVKVKKTWDEYVGKETANKKKQEDPDQEGAGDNLVVKLATDDPDVPENNGYLLTVWLPWPNAADEERFARGRSIADAKMERIAGFVKAFGGAIEGESITLSAGMRGLAFVVQQMNQAGTELSNSIDSFSGFRAIEQ